ncbi:conserved hypothetical protein [Trichinella spiralis]|uniref:hypothetical protein n=1 Tax=Trichinella spiralis TaxID=6334 RepID=UPI0001EFB2A1|nr:conserved hypothetical protein [Trichinella spiralis]
MVIIQQLKLECLLNPRTLELKSENISMLTFSNHHSLCWLETEIVENSIWVCLVYIGADEANKRCFLHFYPSDLTVIEPMLLRHNYAMKSDPMKTRFFANQ